MAIEFPDHKTAVTTAEMAQALSNAWFNYYGTYAPEASIKVLVSQWALETGWGKSMHCYNVGNIKARETDDHCYFACNEVLNTASAKKNYAAAIANGTAKITKEQADGNCIIWFYPKHPGCRFRAYATLDDGAYDYLKLLVEHRTFKRAWPAVLAGNPQEFAKLLHDAGYYTASVASYTASVMRIFNSLKDLQVPSDSLNEAEKLKILNDVYAGMQELTDEQATRDSD